MMRNDGLEEEGIQGMTLNMSKLRLWNLIANLTPKSYLNWVQAIESIFELNDYADEKSFKHGHS